MISDNKILKNLYNDTKSGIVSWNYKKSSNTSTIYYTTYRITRKKELLIYFNYNMSIRHSYIVINYVNSKNDINLEISDIYPYGKFEFFKIRNEKYYFSKLEKLIKKKIKERLDKKDQFKKAIIS